MSATHPQAWLKKTTKKEILELTVKAPNKLCMLDPIQKSIIKKCLADLVPAIAIIVNASLSTGAVPNQFKQAIVTLFLKKSGLDRNNVC